MSRNYWHGQRVLLRAVEPGDAEAHFFWDQDSEIARRLDRVWFPRSRAAAERWAERLATREPEDDTFHFEIENLSGELVGAIATHHCERRAGTFSYGVAVRREHQRRGYAGEAIRLVLRYYFDELRYQKVTVAIHDYNEPSIRLHEKLGFQHEGRLRRLVYTRGRHYDLVMMGLTSEEFAALQRGIGGMPERGPTGLEGGRPAR
jgi:RimJ/RimL family protein N-acetyltransferase